MKNTYAVTALALLNLGTLIFVASHHVVSAQASGPEQVVRARALAIVDAQGKVQASITVIPEGPARRHTVPL
jgi:hypothetical protein